MQASTQGDNNAIITPLVSTHIVPCVEIYNRTRTLSRHRIAMPAIGLSREQKQERHGHSGAGQKVGGSMLAGHMDHSQTSLSGNRILPSGPKLRSQIHREQMQPLPTARKERGQTSPRSSVRPLFSPFPYFCGYYYPPWPSHTAFISTPNFSHQLKRNDDTERHGVDDPPTVSFHTDASAHHQPSFQHAEPSSKLAPSPS